MKSILVAGGTGLVGANLTLKIQKLGLPVMATRHTSTRKEFKDCIPYDFQDYAQCVDATRDKEAVVFSAAIISGAKQNREKLTATILPNLKISMGLLEACAMNKVKTVIIISSSTVYQPAFFPIREDDLDLNTSPFPSYFGVGWTNRLLEQMALLYAQMYGLRVVVFRPTSLYGPYDKFDSEQSHVIPSLIKRALDKEDPFEVWGSPHIVRDFLYVEDFIDDIVYALTHADIPSSTPINVCSGLPLPIGEAVSIVLEVCKHEPKVCFNSDKPSSIPYRALDDTKYKSYFGKRERTPLGVGIQKTVNWYQKRI